MTSWLPQAWTVAVRQEEAPDVVSLGLVPQGDHHPTPAQPGQFNMAYAYGVGEIPLSLSALQAEDRIWHTIRAVGPVSRALCALQVGDALGIRGPYGRGWPLAQLQGQDLLLIAGGLGIAPLRPVLEAVAASRSQFGAVTLLYGGRSPASLLYGAERRAWARVAGVRCLTTVDHGAGVWSGNVGVVTALLPKTLAAPGHTGAFVCGPETMMRFCARDLLHLGIAPTRIFLSLERNMRCALGVCGHCQLSELFVCKDGPVLPLHRLDRLMTVTEL